MLIKGLMARQGGARLVEALVRQGLHSLQILSHVILKPAPKKNHELAATQLDRSFWKHVLFGCRV